MRATAGTSRSIKYGYGFTNLSLSPYGRDAVLGGRGGLAIVDLENPMAAVRTLSLSSMWNISEIAWCPSVEHHGWVATAVNQTLLVHDLVHTNSQPVRVLRAHPMAITDIAWSPQVPSWIGTTSIDPIIKIWDVRRDQKPVWYFSRWEAADLLAFHPNHMFKMASVHRSNRIAVWDIRFGSSPIVTMEDAHAEDITSISWVPGKDDELISSSQDCTVKKWLVAYDSPQELYTHMYPNEITSAEPLPFGSGLLVRQRSLDNKVLAVKDEPKLSVVHEFVGHTGRVLGADWRQTQGGGSSELQLVTWGKDQVLRLWEVGEDMVESIGGSMAEAAESLCASGDGVAPSFATNFVQPDQLLDLYAQETLPTSLMAIGGPNGNKHMLGLGPKPKAKKKAAKKAGVSSSEDSTGPRGAAATATAATAGGRRQRRFARASTTDEHSSDDDEDEDEEGSFGIREAPWRTELDTVRSKYRASRTISLQAMNSDAGTCRLLLAVPWIQSMRELAAILNVVFPTRYPHEPLQIAVEAAGAVHAGRRQKLQYLVDEIAGACAGRGIGSLDRCLHTLLLRLIAGVREAAGDPARATAEDLERLPLPPPPPPLEAEAASIKGTRLGSAGQRRMRGASLRQPWGPASYTSEENASYGDGASDSELMSPSFLHSEDEGDFYSEDEDDFYALGYSDEYDSDLQAGMDAGLPKGMRRGAANGSGGDGQQHRERFDSRIPFPRLCGGVFSGPGQLVCFFASIYPLDKYPEISGAGQQQSREKSREDMVQQLRVQSKPRTFRKLEYYQTMVQFGSQNRNTYLSYDGPGIGADGGGPLAASGGSGHHGVDNEDRDEAQDEEVPRYYFRQQATRVTRSAASGSDPGMDETYFMPRSFSRSDIGNLAVICNEVAGDNTASHGLARLFVLTGQSTEWVCQHNARVASLNGRQELAHVWTLLGCLLGPVRLGTADQAYEHTLWMTHLPVLRWLRAVMKFYERRGDVQTLALLACVLSTALAESHPPPAKVAMAAAQAADVPPWMKAAGTSKARMASFIRETSAAPPGTTNAATAAAAAAAAARNVSFRLPSSSATSLAAHNHPSNLADAQALRRSTAGPLSLTPPLLMRAGETPIGDMQQTLVNNTQEDEDAETDMGPASSAARSDLATQAISDQDVLLQALDSDEIKQNEIMMTEGLDEARTGSLGDGDSKAGESLPENGTDPQQSQQQLRRTSSSENLAAVDGQQSSGGGPDSGENIWRRLRSNVLGRVHTVGGYGGSGGGAASGESKVAADSVPTMAQAAASGGSNSSGGGQRGPEASERKQAPKGVWAALVEQRQNSDNARESVEALELAREVSYLRIKQAAERPHTRMTMRSGPELVVNAEVDIRAQAPYLDHWKLIYSCILFKWGMDIKAVEVLRCVQDAGLRDVLYQMYCQPPAPCHDTLPRVGNLLGGKPALLPTRKRTHEDTALVSKSAKSRRRQPRDEEENKNQGESDSGDGEEAGAPWMSCVWCHEYVHGRALICHACGHGGHQEHMQSWFRTVRRQLMQTGLAPAQYSQGVAAAPMASAVAAAAAAATSNSSSMSNLLRRAQHHLSSQHLVDLPSSATDLPESATYSPMLPASSVENMASSSDVHLATPKPLNDDACRPGGLHMHLGRSSLSRQLSRESLVSNDGDIDAETTDSSDALNGANAKQERSRSLSDASNRSSLYSDVFFAPSPKPPEESTWESSDIDSDDQLRPAQRHLLLRELRANALGDVQEDIAQLERADALLMQSGIPTCASGCGCNCLYESYQMIIR
ncbi:hypothetical protein GGF46_003745 [Coemansia sp. RSA 552]|nr:hypothetical protein GGF46_003745 [Coemansia sp. RSA 552]